MFTKFVNRYCRYCKCNSSMIVHRPSLMTQTIITMLTCGLWLPFAMFAYHWGTTYGCMNCKRVS